MNGLPEQSWPIEDAADDFELDEFIDIGLALRLNPESDRADAG